jgi:hypothetical protein
MQTNTQEQSKTLKIHQDVVGELVMSMMGVDRLAYIKAQQNNGFTVYSADGTQLAAFESHDEAYDAIIRHNLTPVRVH